MVNRNGLWNRRHGFESYRDYSISFYSLTFDSQIMAKFYHALMCLVLASVLLTSATVYGITPQELQNRIKGLIGQEGLDKVNEVVGGNFSSIDDIQMRFVVNGTDVSYFWVSQYGNTSLVPIVINGTVVNGTQTPPPVKVEICGDGIDNDGDGLVDEGCPVLPPAQNITTINFAGDFLGSTVIQAMDKKTADFNVATGDLGYKSTLTAFKSDWNKLDGHKCIPGNHDQDEDGSPSLTKESNAYCGEYWNEKVANGTTLLVAWNSNGNMDVLLGKAQETVMNETTMKGVKNVVLIQHKPCENHPNSHHGVETDIKTFCQSFDAKVPQGVAIYHIAAHEHEIASTSGGHKFLVGGGGQTSHRSCSTDSTWTFCKETNGFLRMEINNLGDITAKFYNTNGGVIS